MGEKERKVAGGVIFDPDDLAAWRQHVVVLDLPDGWEGIVRVDHVPANAGEPECVEQNT